MQKVFKKHVFFNRGLLVMGVLKGSKRPRVFVENSIGRIMKKFKRHQPALRVAAVE